MTDSTGHEFFDRLERYRPLLDPGEIDALLAAAQRPPLPALRVNTLKRTEANARGDWPNRYGWQIAPVPFCPAGWQIEAHIQPLGQTIEYDNGQYYIQDAASMLPAELFSTDVEQPLILDLAAAPGGKTTHLASRFTDRGVIVANDSSAKRLAALRANLQSWGVFGALVTNFPGERFGRWMPEQFDKVLLDAPCSGDTLRASTGRKTRHVSDSEREALCQRQDALLTSAFLAVRPGGEIVYSTCTLAPEEDEGVIDALLRAFPGLVEVDAVEHVPVARTAPGLAADGARVFLPGVRHTVRLWPHHFRTSGFFAARLRKTGPVSAPSEMLTPRAWTLDPYRGRERTALVTRWRDAYGFDLDAILDTHGLTLWQRDKALFAIPDLLQKHFEHVPYLAAGLLVGHLTGDRAIPAHELITRFETQFTGARLILTNDQVNTWIDGRDLRDAGAVAAPPGTVILIQDVEGRFLGLGAVQRDRVRNLRPRRLTYQG